MIVVFPFAVAAPYAVMARISDRVRTAADVEREAALAKQRASWTNIIPRPPGIALPHDDNPASDAEWDRAESQIAAEECADTYAGMWW